MVFTIAAEIYIFGAILYIILGKGERQPWAGGGDEEGVAKGINQTPRTSGIHSIQDTKHNT